MVKEKKKLNKLIKSWGIIFILSFASIIVLSSAINEYLNFKKNSTEMRTNYIDQQKELIKSQVESVVSRINSEKLQVERAAKNK